MNRHARSFAASLALLLAACKPSPPTPSPTAQTQAPAASSEPLRVSDCSVGRLALIDGVELPMDEHDAIMALKLQKYADRGREIPKTADDIEAWTQP